MFAEYTEKIFCKQHALGMKRLGTSCKKGYWIFAYLAVGALVFLIMDGFVLSASPYIIRRKSLVCVAIEQSHEFIQDGGPETMAPVWSEDGGPETMAPVRSEDGGPETMAPLMSEDGGPETMVPLRSEDGGPETMGPVRSDDGEPETMAPVRSDDGEPETMAPVRSEDGGPETMAPVSSDNEKLYEFIDRLREICAEEQGYYKGLLDIVLDAIDLVRGVKDIRSFEVTPRRSGCKFLSYAMIAIMLKCFWVWCIIGYVRGCCKDVKREYRSMIWRSCSERKCIKFDVTLLRELCDDDD